MKITFVFSAALAVVGLVDASGIAHAQKRDEILAWNNPKCVKKYHDGCYWEGGEKICPTTTTAWTTSSAGETTTASTTEATTDSTTTTTDFTTSTESTTTTTESTTTTTESTTTTTESTTITTSASTTESTTASTTASTTTSSAAANCNIANSYCVVIDPSTCCSGICNGLALSPVGFCA